MQRFVARHNVQHFRELLAKETDPKQRAMLDKLLGEELAKLAAEASDGPEAGADAPGEAPGPPAEGSTPG